MSAKPSLEGRIAILGSGREGISAFHHLEARGTGESLQIITEALSGHPQEAGLQARGVLRVCPFSEAELRQYDILIRSPGVSPYRETLQQAGEAGVRILTPSTIWFAENPDAKTIVITGTKGKSTTASLLAHMLETTGLKVCLAGNIGTPLLACKGKDVDWWVIELSSYQIADLEAQPSVGVLLNLATDHLDWHGSEARYHRDKLRLSDIVAPGGLIANRSDSRLRSALAGRIGVEWFEALSEETASFKMPASLPGKHNRANLAACLAVTRKIGLDDDAVLAGLARFEGLPHRLRPVAIIDSVEFVDDSISTAPVATIAALESFSDREVVLLLGGFERGIDWRPYSDAIIEYKPLAIIAMPDNGPRILQALENAGLETKLESVIASNLAEAVEKAREIAPPRSVVLLSPGAPSFPHFRNYEDRGRQFARICAGLDNQQ